MNCQEARQHLSDWIDEQEKELSAEVREHLDCCPDCCCCLDEFKELDRELSALPDIRVPSEVHQSVIRAVRGHEVRPGWWRQLADYFRITRPRLAFAGSLFVVLASLLILQPWRDASTIYDVVQEELIEPGYDHVAWKLGVDRFVDDLSVRSAQFARRELDGELNRLSTRTATGILQTVGNIQFASDEGR